MTDARQSNLSPQMTLIELAEGYRISKALDVVAELGIADLLKESPKTCVELAQATSTHAPSLYRLMRAMASSGIFREDDQGRFENTPLSEVLRADVPHSVKDSVRCIPNDGGMLAWMRLMDVLKTGKPSYKDATGFSTWEYLQEYPEKAKLFNKNMTFFSSELAPVILDNYDFSAFKSVVDMGGGEGLLLANILNAYPQLHGVLFDIPSVTEQAKDYLHQKRGFSNRCEIIAGSILEEIPSGYDAYIMKNVLHDWSDEDTLQIFQECRKALPDHGKLIIFDAVMLPGNEPQKCKWLDLQMLIAFGGKERTAEEFKDLLSCANFKITKAIPLPTPIGMGIIEAIPV
ncbi:methyltransferase [Desulfobulbus sp. TB]|nr:methyltransferase [Desulfobulbus sp. TB]